MTTPPLGPQMAVSLSVLAPVTDSILTALRSKATGDPDANGWRTVNADICRPLDMTPEDFRVHLEVLQGYGALRLVAGGLGGWQVRTEEPRNG